jgi:hypothetical protein
MCKPPTFFKTFYDFIEFILFIRLAHGDNSIIWNLILKDKISPKNSDCELLKLIKMYPFTRVLKQIKSFDDLILFIALPPR